MGHFYTKQTVARPEDETVQVDFASFLTKKKLNTPDEPEASPCKIHGKTSSDYGSSRTHYPPAY